MGFFELFYLYFLFFIIFIFLNLNLAKILIVLFNDALKTFYLQLYCVGHMIKDHVDSQRGNPLPPLHGLP